ncbi:MAG: deoxyribose-phosphate aldolase, partial [Deltaproteobacteria bacterium]|nr:deoxyribose-phosphate aldolase [Deltaproteobacteria bacterium]
MIDFKNPQDIAAIIDQTLLKPTANLDQVQRFCEESATLGFASVCIAPCWVRVAARAIASSGVRICTVAGFPLGFEPLELKVQAVQAALDSGADEIDYVVNLGAVKGGDYELVNTEMRAMRQAADTVLIKVILETGHLTQKEIKRLCQLAVETEIDFVKTSTGLGPTGASVAEVKLLAECGQGRIKVKAAGGIRTLQDLRKMITAGAQRIGTSAGKEIVAEV